MDSLLCSVASRLPREHHHHHHLRRRRARACACEAAESVDPSISVVASLPRPAGRLCGSARLSGDLAAAAAADDQKFA